MHSYADRAACTLLSVCNVNAGPTASDSTKNIDAWELCCRAELGLMDDYYQTSAGQRERLLQATDRLDKTSNRIQQGRQQLLETEVRRVEMGLWDERGPC